MPWPVTHILIAEKTFETHFHHLNRTAFILGTCFPDIRYPAQVERERTHFNHITLEGIKAKPAFNAGMHFHSLTDTAWNSYVHQHRVRLFSAIPHNSAVLHTLKILQDKYLYHMYQNWGKITVMFETILAEEYDFGIPEVVLGGWHTLLAEYLSKSPAYDDLQMLNLTLPKDLVEDIRRYYLAYQDHPIVQEIMIGFYDSAAQYLD